MNEYQITANNFRNKDLSPERERMMCVLGIASETGEIAEAIKHAEFHGHTLDHANLKLELGDLLWYLSALCSHYGWSLNEIAESNIHKLATRYPNGFDPRRSRDRIENVTRAVAIAHPRVLVWDRPGGVYKEGVRICEIDAVGHILKSRSPTEAEMIAIEQGHIPERNHDNPIQT